MRLGVVGLAGAGALALCALPAVASRDAAPARVQVVEKEYSLTLSRLRVHSGRVTVQVVNFGMDEHDLVIQSNKSSASTWKSSLLAPEAIATKTLTLTRGKYTLFCSLPGHRQLGMVATLTVT
jgi:uncharacterized cupredoxin-like copper-binding protein